jgi:DNA-binding response OmpR family regulator
VPVTNFVGYPEDVPHPGAQWRSQVTLRRILVAEDDDALRGLVERYLRDEGFEVEVAGNGKRALSVARRTPPDLLILDVNMPVMDAPAVLESWMADDALRGVPVLLVSAEPTLSEIAAHYGVRSSLAKPFDLDVLRAIVDQLLAHPEPPPNLPTVGAG